MLEGDCLKTKARPGLAELRAARTGALGPIWAAFLFSALVNLLMFAPPLYMLQVYDRVLVSRSAETLLALTVILAFVFGVMGVVDHARGRILARVGARLHVALEDRILAAAFRRLAVTPRDPGALAAHEDLDAIVRLWASPALVAVLDAPWAPVFIAAIFAFHPWLGLLAVCGGLVIAGLSWLNRHASDTAVQTATRDGHTAAWLTGALKSEAELLQSLGMGTAARARVRERRDQAMVSGLVALDASGGYSVAVRTFRLFLQSAMLGLAAWLVLRDELSAGAMIAASVLMGRALQPVEQAVGHWTVIARARHANRRLAMLLAATPALPPRLALPRPAADIDVQGLSVCPPGKAETVLTNVAFALPAGTALAVIGPSGAGKTTLARSLTGVWTPSAGRIRLGGAALDQYDPDRLGALVGYLPQRVTLFDGSIADNIARLQPGADPGHIIAAARAAGAHDMILSLPDGYDTPVAAVGNQLSGGQIQRIGLARALYGDPVLLILDEPNASLDMDGAAALNAAIRSAKARGASVIVMAHRPQAIQECELLLVLHQGTVAAFGPRDLVLQKAAQAQAKPNPAFLPKGAA